MSLRHSTGLGILLYSLFLRLHSLLLLELLLLLEHHGRLILLLLLLQGNHLGLHDLLLLRRHLSHHRLVLNKLLLLLLLELELLLSQVQILLLCKATRSRGAFSAWWLVFWGFNHCLVDWREPENAAAWLLGFEACGVLVKIF